MTPQDKPERVRLIEALAENAEVRSWNCATCDTMVEDSGPHCRSCAIYWEDASAGLFDDEWSPLPPEQEQ